MNGHPALGFRLRDLTLVASASDRLARVPICDASQRRAFESLSATSLPLLLHARAGTGRRWLARWIHARSGRSGPLLELDGACPCCNPTRAAATSLGAAFDQARGGTLYVRDLPSLPASWTAALASSLDEPAPGTARVVACADPEADPVGRELRDRFAELDPTPIAAHPQDLEPIVAFFLHVHALSARAPEPALFQVSLSRLRSYPWPGDLEELEHFAQRAVALGSVEAALGMLHDDDLVERACSGAVLWEMACDRIANGRQIPLDRVRQRLVAAAERAWTRRVLDGVGGDFTVAAQALGITPDALRSRVALPGAPTRMSR